MYFGKQRGLGGNKENNYIRVFLLQFLLFKLKARNDNTILLYFYRAEQERGEGCSAVPKCGEGRKGGSRNPSPDRRRGRPGTDGPG